MESTERTAIWAVTIITAVGLLILGVVVAAELGEINRRLAALVPAEDAPTSPQSTPTLGGLGSDPSPSSGAAGAEVGITDLYILTDTVSLLVTVRAHGAGDLLFEPPVLTDGALALPILDSSHEDARWSFLDIVTRGTATARLEFAGGFDAPEVVWLVFNPSQDPSNVVAPPLWVEIQLSETGEQAGEP